jgi:hypothetical protein
MSLIGAVLVIALSGTVQAAEPATMPSAPSRPVVIYTKDKPPATPKMDDLPLNPAYSPDPGVFRCAAPFHRVNRGC